MSYNKKVPCECGRGPRSAQAPRCKQCGVELRCANMRDARKPEREPAPEWDVDRSRALLSLPFGKRMRA